MLRALVCHILGSKSTSDNLKGVEYRFLNRLIKFSLIQQNNPMANTKLEASRTTYYELILQRNISLRVPRFQRHYCWTGREVSMLLDDVFSLKTNLLIDETKFLGAVIVARVSGSTASRNESFDIIDGQQRLITIFCLLAKVCADAAEYAKNSSTTSKEANERLNRLEEFAIDTAESMILQIGKDKGYPKIFPSFNDKDEFGTVLKCLDFLQNPPANLGQATPKEGALSSAVDHMTKRLIAQRDENKKQVSGEDLVIECCDFYESLIDVFRNKLEFIEVQLADHHDPSHVFDRLNVQGQELTVFDLARNEIFRYFEKDNKKAETFYKQKWMPFEDEFVAPIKRKDIPTPKDFTNHRIGFWHPYALTKEGSVKSSPRSIFETLKRVWQTDSITSKLPEIILEDLRTYMPIYNAITEGEDYKPLSKHKAIWDMLTRLREIEVPKATYAYLFLLLKHATEQPLDANNSKKCLELIESYVMRRALMNDDSSVKNVFNNAWKIAGSNPKLLAYVLDDKSRPFPTDDEILEHGAKEQANFYSLKKRARFFLEQYEKETFKGDPYKADRPTLDHIMPQERLPNWGTISADDHENYLNSIGNIVLLTNTSNSSKSNRSWEDAKRIYTNESKTRQSAEIGKKKSWGVREIQARSEKLLTWGIKNWPRPKLQTTKTEIANDIRKMRLKEQKSVAEKLKAHGIKAGFLIKTANMHEKSTFDAKESFRKWLEDEKIHDYDSQLKQKLNKVHKECFFYLGAGNIRKSRLQFIISENGGRNDKRVWPLQHNDFAGKWSLTAFVKKGKSIYLINCSESLALDDFIKDYKKLN
ncbi:MAG: DUF262 domain-containing protein [Rubripirellula sp.]